jgi:hypothetical protein
VLDLVWQEEIRRSNPHATCECDCCERKVRPRGEKKWCQPATGAVYVLGTRGGFCKIGRATDISSRLAKLRTASPFELFVVAVIATDRPDFEEAIYHKVFKHAHIHREWFSLTPEEIGWLRNQEEIAEWGLSCSGPTPAVPPEWRGPYIDPPLAVSIDVDRRALAALAA